VTLADLTGKKYKGGLSQTEYLSLALPDTKYNEIEISMYRIRMRKSPSVYTRVSKVTMIDGFEVWREGSKWHAHKGNCSMEASTKKAIKEMIWQN
jgi:hypothetical protein